MLGENEKDTQLAYQLEDRIIRIHECDGGYDYSIMDKNYREIDGGVYDDPDADIHYVLLTIAEELKMYPDTNGAKGQITMESKLVPLDYEEVVMNEEEVNHLGPAVYQSREIMEFKAQTEECFQPIGGMTPAEIEELVRDFIQTMIYENDFDAEIRDVVISGSRCRGLEKKTSDLDVVVEYTGDEREDDMYNLLHSEKLFIGDVPVDINPITGYKTGTLEEYLPGVEKYLEEKRCRASVRGKLKEKQAAVKENSAKSEKDVQRKKENLR